MNTALIRFAILWAALSTVLIHATPEIPAEETQDQPPLVEITPETRQAIDRGLEFLAREQSSNGSYGSGVPVAVTSLAGLAFLAGGHTPSQGKYAENVDKIMKYLLRNCSKRGYISEGGPGGGSSRMHGHGYATLFLAETYATLRSPDQNRVLREYLKKAVEVIEQSQDPNGGWTYEPSPSGHEGSVTITQVTALWSARNAGIQVKKQVIEKAIEYIRKSTNPDGTVNYSLGERRSSFALTGAGMSVLTYLAQYEDKRIDKGLDYILKNFLPGKIKKTDDYSVQSYYFYSNFYATIAMFKKGGSHWETWFPAMRDELVHGQDASGRFQAKQAAYENQYSPAFGTAYALLMLQMPYRYLPIFQN